jgi:hypothetical protein
MSEKFNRIVQGPSSMKLVRVEDPSVGGEVVYQFDEGYTYRIQSLNFLLTTSAVVDDRWPYLTLLRGGDYVAFLIPAGKTVASEAIRYHWHHGATIGDVSAIYPHVVSQLARNLYVVGGDILITETLGIDVGDQYSEINLNLQKWPVAED